jgi:hypothetical protein
MSTLTLILAVAGIALGVAAIVLPSARLAGGAAVCLGLAITLPHVN